MFTKLEKYQIPNLDKTDIGLGNVLDIQQQPAIFWNTIVGDITAVVQRGYIVNGLGIREIQLPTSSAIGDSIIIMGNQADGFRITQNASHKIRMGEEQTTPGVGGYLESTNKYDQLTLICIETNQTWRVLNPQGNLKLI